MARQRLQPGIELGRIVGEYSREQAHELVERWLAAFARQGFGTMSKQYLWHIFSSASTPALRGQQALDRYETQACVEYVVLANDGKKAYLTASRPVRSLHRDWFVFPPNLAWTMAFTHEDGWLGPYFATHPEHERLDAENRALLRKQAEADLARERGWR